MALMQTDMDRPSWAQSFGFGFQGLLGGSWVVISGVISPLVRVISIATLLITLLVTTHELQGLGFVEDGWAQPLGGESLVVLGFGVQGFRDCFGEAVELWLRV